MPPQAPVETQQTRQARDRGSNEYGRFQKALVILRISLVAPASGRARYRALSILEVVWYMYGARSSWTKVLLQRALCRGRSRVETSMIYHVVVHVIDVTFDGGVDRLQRPTTSR